MILDIPTNADIMRSVHDAQARLGLEPELAFAHHSTTFDVEYRAARRALDVLRQELLQ